MRFRITEDAYGRYRVYRRFLGLLWIDLYYIGDYREYHMDLLAAEEYVKVICNRARHTKEKPKVVKEIVCNEN